MPCAKCVLRIERCRTKQDEGRRRERRLSRSSSSSSTRGISGAGNELCRSASHLKATPTQPHAAPPSLSASLHTRFSSEVVSGARMLRQNTISRDHNRQRVRKNSYTTKKCSARTRTCGRAGAYKETRTEGHAARSDTWGAQGTPASCWPPPCVRFREKTQWIPTPCWTSTNQPKATIQLASCSRGASAEALRARATRAVWASCGSARRAPAQSRGTRCGRWRAGRRAGCTSRAAA